MKKVFLFATIFFIIFNLFSCKKTKNNEVKLYEENINMSSYHLQTYYTNQNSQYLVVFESGLGDDHSVWTKNNLHKTIAQKADILLYDRQGYGQSTADTSLPHDIEHLSNDLATVISHYANGRKIILVGHSLGGMIVRAYAIKHAAQTQAILFVDTSHEMYNNPDAEEQQLINSIMISAFGKYSGADLESRQLTYDAQYMSQLSVLPNVPIVALTSMKIDDQHDEADRQLWYASKEALKTGVSDFTHIATTLSGHYIMLDQPELVTNNLNVLLNKLK